MSLWVRRGKIRPSLYPWCKFGLNLRCLSYAETTTASIRTTYAYLSCDSTAQFHSLLAQGIPIVVDVDRRKLQGGWTPRDFIKYFGDRRIKVVNAQTNHSFHSTVKAFFEQFGQSRASTEVLKLKDWPPEKNFRVAFSDHYESFVDSVPFPDTTRPDGTLNMRSHYPKNGVVPDLGPKMYNAFGTMEGENGNGSTRLHMDITDAVNIMAYAEPFPDGRPGSARWDIFPQASVGKLREFLRVHGGFKGVGDPIHSQTIYLTPTLLKTLEEQHGIRPYTIYQIPGQAVYIPAGCPHQVSNQTDAVKVACDFLSIENLSVTERLAHDFRRHRLAGGFAPDVLQLYPTLWYAWRALGLLYVALSPQDTAVTT
ncbi:hypothetical protein BV25DRAFT_1800975, partial [Artomyces pyxidatus]